MSDATDNRFYREKTILDRERDQREQVEKKMIEYQRQLAMNPTRAGDIQGASAGQQIQQGFQGGNPPPTAVEVQVQNCMDRFTGLRLAVDELEEMLEPFSHCAGIGAPSKGVDLDEPCVRSGAFLNRLQAFTELIEYEIGRVRSIAGRIRA